MTNRQCSKLVCSTKSFGRDQCPRKGVLFEKGEHWCEQHAPSARRDAKNNARLEASRYERRGKEFHDALKLIAAYPTPKGGNTDAQFMRDLARAVLDKMEEGEHR